MELNALKNLVAQYDARHRSWLEWWRGDDPQITWLRTYIRDIETPGNQFYQITPTFARFQEHYGRDLDLSRAYLDSGTPAANVLNSLEQADHQPAPLPAPIPALALRVPAGLLVLANFVAQNRAAILAGINANPGANNLIMVIGPNNRPLVLSKDHPAILARGDDGTPSIGA